MQNSSCFTIQILVELVVISSLTATLPLKNINSAWGFSCQRQMFGCIFFDHSCLPFAFQLQSHPPQRGHDFNTSWLSKGERVIDHYSILTSEVIGFSQELLQP